MFVLLGIGAIAFAFAHLKMYLTLLSMVETWQRSSTYEHCWLAVPVALLMIALMPPAGPAHPYLPGLLAVAGAVGLWLIGQHSGAAVVEQLALVGLVIAVVLTVQGPAWVRAMAFPLGFLFFAVPFGDELLPVLVPLTADVTVWTLRVAGVPVLQEGTTFITPAGTWQVVEACGGVRYLLATLILGYLFAGLQPWSMRRRVVFIGIALALALVANWLRAVIIVQSELTTTYHNMAGWLIFATVMLGFLWTNAQIGGRKRQWSHR